MLEEIDSISFSDLFWIQYKDDRISFRINGLPEDIHFTISWHKNSSKVNLHITKNVGDEGNKPKIVIAEFKKSIIEELVSLIPVCILNSLYSPISFKKYSRKSRKNIRLCYLDELEKHKFCIPIEEMVTQIFKEASTIKRKKLRVRSNLENNFIPILHSAEMRFLFLSNLKSLNSRSFASGTNRAGVLFMGKKTFQFISSNGKCYIQRQKMTIYDLLTSFMKPELARSLINLTNEALEQIKNAETFNDTIPFNRPYQLFIENVN
jgi:hypothetical protein